MTNVLNDKIFLYIDPLASTRLISPKIHNLPKSKIYYKNQLQSDFNLQYYSCSETGRRKQQCENEKVCIVSRNPGHILGATECKHYVDTSEVVDVFIQGKSNPHSIFIPCDLKLFGEHHKSVEHAFRLPSFKS